MSAKEYLEEAISQASKDLEEYETDYFAMKHSERTYTQYGIRLAERIENLRDAIEHLLKADSLID